MELDELRRELQKGETARIYLFYGPEEFVRDHYLDLVEKCVLRDSPPEFNKTVFRGKTGLRDIYEASMQPPVFGEQRFVVVRRSGLFKSDTDERTTGKGGAKSGMKGGAKAWMKSGAKAGAKDGAKADESAEEYIGGIPEYACVVFVEEQVSADSPLFHMLSRCGKVVEFRHLNPGSVEIWLAKEAAKYGKQFDRGAAARLAEYCDPGLNTISMELEKLLLYTYDRKTITLNDIENVTIRSMKSRIFDFTDAVLAGDMAKAESTLDVLLALKEHLHGILVFLASHFRLLIRIRALLDSGIEPNERNVGIRAAAYTVRKGISQVRKVSVRQLEGSINIMLECDRSVKAGKISEDIAARLLIGEIIRNSLTNEKRI